jgi:uncharacterized protein
VQIGIISDTHGFLRPEALEALKGSDQIIHAGDVGSWDIITLLETVAPVAAVRGNMDGGAWGQRLPRTQALELKGVGIYVLHDLAALDLDPGAGGFAIVISGHTHRPKVEKHKGVTYINPGSAGSRRHKEPVTVARVQLAGDEFEVEVIELEC